MVSGKRDNWRREKIIFRSGNNVSGTEIKKRHRESGRQWYPVVVEAWLNMTMSGCIAGRGSSERRRAGRILTLEALEVERRWWPLFHLQLSVIEGRSVGIVGGSKGVCGGCILFGSTNWHAECTLPILWALPLLLVSLLSFLLIFSTEFVWICFLQIRGQSLKIETKIVKKQWFFNVLCWV